MHHIWAFIQKTVFAVVLLLSLFIAAYAEGPASKVTALPAESADQAIVAKVNGKNITALQLKHAVKSLLSKDPTAKLPPETLKKVNRNVLERLIRLELLYQAGLTLENKELDKIINDRINKEKSKYAGVTEFNQMLSSLGISESEFYENMRRDTIIKNFISKVIDAKITVKEDEIRKVYEQNIDEFTQPEQVRISNILIGVNASMGADEKKKAREKAEKIHSELLKGASFVELARANSDSISKKFGGDLSYVTKEQMDPVVAQAVSALKVGQLSEVLETPTGFHIIKLRDRRPSVTKPYDEVRSQIEKYIKEIRLQAASEEYLNNLHKSAKIDVLLK
jgi:parvulin-like peptidyl-prolyl isomerase